METIITGGIGIVTAIISSWATWFFAKRKYNSEVDNNLIQNMKESLDFYKQLSDDNRKRLEEVLDKNKNLEEEVKELRTQLFGIMSSICTDLTCQIRRREFSNLDMFKHEKSHSE